ncbi:serine hydrolase domain-containing protein [Sandarakinorhabdus sp. DWP1-3-1]|uniref:serine hydrolase domain-containing protein n=1 Tax=Sandarakinorhabdus sp. DWP1-3-1 TaxID=2804627 RepID=UPI003CF442D1
MIVTALALLLATPAAADSQTRAFAAGYKAAFLCSGVFNAGQTPGQVAADDLTGIYPEYQALVGDLPYALDRVRHTVSVRYDPALPPRVAAWRPLLGCSQLPIGASDPRILPRLTPDFRPPSLAKVDAARWPLGDAGATLRLPRYQSAPLNRVVAEAFTPKFGGDNGGKPSTTAVIILKNGRIVAERYRAGYGRHTPQRTWSVAKSLAATLVGRGVQLGRIDVTAPAAIPQWQGRGDPRRAITTEQLLRMNSGLAAGPAGNRTDAVYVGGDTVTRTAAQMPPERPPGTHFNYANNDIMLAALALETGLERRAKGSALGFPFTELLWPLGMTRTTPETDWQGHFVLSSQVWMTARDLARLAILYENNGKAGGRQLLPPGWRRLVSTPAGAQPTPVVPGRGGYGAGFWLFGKTDDMPEGSYAMLGNRGQFALIIPTRHIIVIRRGFDAPGQNFDALAFSRAVLHTLK